MSEALSTIPQSTIRSSIWFLEDDPLYATVKPYSLAFTPEAQIPRDNIQRTEVPVSISDLRGNEERFDLDLNGFRVLRFRDEHNEIDWDEVKMVEDLHYPRVVSAVEQLIPGAQCIALHHQVSPRHTRTWGQLRIVCLRRLTHVPQDPKARRFVSKINRRRLHAWPAVARSSHW